MTTIGYATLAIIPSLDGVSEAIDKQLGGKLQVSGKRGGKQFAKGLGDGLKDLEREVDSATKAYDKLRDRASDAVGKVRVEEEKLAKARAGGKSDQIAVAEERLAKARRDSTRATKDAEAGSRSLLDAQRRLGAASDDSGRKFGRMGDVLDGAKGKMLAAGAVAGGAALAGLTALGAGAVVAANRLYELGAQFDDLADNLQVKTGLSGSALDQLQKSVERLGTTNVPSSFAEIGDVAAEVTRNLHLTGPEFDAVTSRLANLQRMDVGVDIRELGKAFRGFGVDAKNQAPALDSLYEASTKSGLSIDDMLGAMVKAGPALRQFGLSFGESAALITTFEEAGVDADKTIATLNRAFAYFAEKGVPAQKGLRDVVAQIQNLIAVGDEAGAAELTNKVFGTRGGVNFFELIRTGAVDLQSLSSGLQSTGLDINQVAEDTADWSERWQDLKNEVAVALEPLAGRVFDGVNEQLGELADWVSQHQDEVVDFFVAIADAAVIAGEFIIKSIGGAARDLGSFLEPIGDVLGAVHRFQAWQADIRGDHETADELRKQADSFFGLGEGLQEFGDKAANFNLDELRDSIRSIGDEAKGADGKVDPLPGTIDGIGASAGAATPKVEDLGRALRDMPAINGSLLPGAPGAGGPLVGPGLGGAPDLSQLRPGGGGQGAGLSLQLASQGKYGLPAGTGISYGAKGFPDWVYQVADAFGIKASTYPGHQEGSGQNQGIDWSGPVENMQRFAEYVAKNGLAEQVIWRNPNTGQNLGLTPQGQVVTDSGGYYSGDWAGHTDHVHTRSSVPIPLPGATVSKSSGTTGMSLWDEIAKFESSGDWSNNNSGGHSTSSGAPRGGLQITDGTWRAFGGTEFAPTANLATKEQQIAVAERIAFTGYNGAAPQGLGAWEVVTKGMTPNVNVNTPQSAFRTPGAAGPASLNLTNAYGQGYEPGIGTPGYNEYGEPGYFRADPKDVREAQQRIDDQMERIREADESARQSQVAIDDLEVDADQAERDAALERKRKADYDAQVARRELADLQDALGEAQRGTFSPAKESPKSKGGGGGTGFSLPSSFSGFGSAIGEFVGGQISSGLGVFGVGDSPGWLKGISQLIGGIKVSDSAGNPLFDGSNLFSSAPFSASPAAMGVPVDSSVHGTRAGAQPGPQVVYNIAARDTEDAFIKAQRVERERAAAKLARF